jgi:hypothetical protein
MRFATAFILALLLVSPVSAQYSWRPSFYRRAQVHIEHPPQLSSFYQSPSGGWHLRPANVFEQRSTVTITPGYFLWEE